MRVNDWAREAAQAILEIHDVDIDSLLSGDVLVEVIRDVIVKHCPFKPDTAYVEVGSGKNPPPPASDVGGLEKKGL